MKRNENSINSLKYFSANGFSLDRNEKNISILSLAFALDRITRLLILPIVVCVCVNV